MLSRWFDSHVLVRALGVVLVFLLGASLFFHPTPFAAGQANFEVKKRAIDPKGRPEDAKTYALDVLSFGRTEIPLRGAPRPIRIPSGRDVSIAGWAVDPQTFEKARGISTELDNETPQPVAGYGVERADVANALQSDGAKESGFTAHVALPSQALGRHAIKFIVDTTSGRRFVFPTPIDIEIVRSI